MATEYQVTFRGTTVNPEHLAPIGVSVTCFWQDDFWVVAESEEEAIAQARKMSIQPEVRVGMEVSCEAVPYRK